MPLATLLLADLEVLLEVRRLGGAAGQRGDSWDLGQQPELGGAA